MTSLFYSAENRAIFDAARLRVIDTGATYRAAIPDCAPFTADHLWMTDGQHMSVEAAIRFGAVLLADLAKP
jgi:hypothetical protein